MRQNKHKRQIAGLLAAIMIVSYNLNPIGLLGQVIADSGILKDFGTIGSNIQYVLENGDPYKVKESYAENAGSSSTTIVGCDCDVTVNVDTDGVIDAVNNANANISTSIGNASENIGGLINNSTEVVTGAIHVTNTAIGQWGEQITKNQVAIKETIVAESGNLQNKMAECTSQIMANDDKNTQLIIDAIENMQHAYKVGYLYSVNNSQQECLWKPTLKELPDIAALAYATTGYAAVYTGFWDAGVDNKTVKNKASATFGERYATTTAVNSMRALNILGYDALVRAEGYAGSGTTGKYTRVLIPENQVSWGDAVQVLYKALGEEILSYSYHTATAEIKPENSPLSQSLSNITEFDTSEGEYYLFVSRSNRLYGNDLTQTDAVYWTRALHDSLVNKDDFNNPITWSEFIILAARMCELYGIETYSQQEANQLLQIYGLEYPVQQGVELADAWTYLKIRGILNVDDITYTSPVCRENLLNVAMCIADESSRTDYKQIQITQSIDDKLVNAGYYPAKNVNYTADSLNVKNEFDYNKSEYYDYMVSVTSEKVATAFTSAGEINITTEFMTQTGGKQFNLAAYDESGKVIVGAEVAGNVLINSDKFYRIKVPKTYKGKVIIKPVGDKTVYPSAIIIDATSLGGGVYNSFTVDTSDPTRLVCLTKSGFSVMKGDAWLKYVDEARCSNQKTRDVALTHNPTVFEYLAYQWDKWTTPMEVMAAETEVSYSGKNFDNIKVTISKDESIAADKDIDSSKYTNLVLGLPGFFNRYAILTELPALQELFSSNLFTIDASAGNKNITVGKALTELYSFIAGDASYYFNYFTEQGFSSWGKIWESNSFASYKDIGNGSYNELVYNCLIEATKDEQNKNMYLAFLYGYGCNSARTFRYDPSDPSNYFSNKTENFYSPTEAKNLGDLKDAAPEEYKTAIVYLSNIANQLYTMYNSGYIEVVNGLSTGNYRFPTISRYSTSAENKLANGEAYDYKAQDEVYIISGSKEDKIKSILGDVLNNESTEPVVDAPEDTVTQGEKAANNMLNITVASSTIMSKDGSFMLSWEDIVNSGYVFNTFGKTGDKLNQPVPDENGVYHIYTKNGVVLVSETAKFILLGTTYYNMADSSGKGPVLVWYSDKDKMTYFDYRVIMGINCYNYTVTGTKVDIEESSVGTGEAVVMTLNSTGQQNSLMTTKEVTTYNYPDMPGDDCESSYGMTAIISTNYDGVEYQDKDASYNFTYWGDDDCNKMVRVPLASFAPTANWITVIKKYGDESGQPEAGLFVYYPRNAFVSSGDNFIGRENLESYLVDIATADAYGDKSIAEVVNNLKTASSEIGVTFDYETNWYDRMTVEALGHLYRLTRGRYVSSHDWSIRYFDLTDNSAVFGTNGHKKDKTAIADNDRIRYGNKPGSIYWLEGIGFVVNVPLVADFDFSKYLSGEIPLPLCYATQDGGFSAAGIINVNPDDYKGIVGYNDAYGNCVGKTSVYNAFNINDSSHGRIGDLVAKDGNEDIAPYNLTGSIYAPAGIYHFITPCVKQEFITSKDFSKQLLSSDRVFLGSQRLMYSDDSTGEELHVRRGTDQGLSLVCTDSAKYYRVLINNSYAVYIASSQGLSFAQPDLISDVQVETTVKSDVVDYLSGLKFQRLVKQLDSFMSWVVMFVFYVFPLLGLIATTILTGISFLGQNKAFVRVVETIGIDPVKFLTFGRYTVQELNFRNTWVSTVVLWITCALMLNCNLIKIINWCLTWVDYISKIFNRAI